jgi:hypothetical protein
MASPSSSGGWPRAKPARLLIGFLLFQQCLAMGCAESASQRARRLEPMLAQAGSRIVPANTPARTERLSQMTPLKLKYVSRNGKSSYWFADPDVCHCLYVGSQHNYDEFQQFKQERAQTVTQESEQRIYDEFMASPAGEVFYGE